MRHPIAPAGLALLLLGLVAAAPRPAAADTALGTSTWSLEVASDLGTGENDVSFAVRRHSGASSAFRVAIELDVDKSDGDGVRTDTGNPDTDEEQLSESSEQALSIQWMRFAAIRDNVTATFAIGPIVRKDLSHFRQETNVGLPSFNGFEQTQKTTTYGLNLGLGVEWFLSSRISLGGQSGLRAMTGKTKLASIQRSGTGPTYQKDEVAIDLDVTEITTATARLQLTAYF